MTLDRQKLPRTRYKGFTLSELLIAVAVLGLIATFTIPKVLMSVQNRADNAHGKEMIATLTIAMQAYLKDNSVTATSFNPQLLKPLLQFTRTDTSNQLGTTGPSGSYTCTNYECLIMQGGGCLQLGDDTWSEGTDGTNKYSIAGAFDPDCLGPKDALRLWFVNEGKVITTGSSQRTWTSGEGADWDDTTDPDWFSWN